MKKMLLSLLLACTMLLAFACNAKECDLCGEKGRGETEEILGEKIFICNDCQKDLEDFGNSFR